MSEILTGDESRELIREYYRMRRRARVLIGSAESAASAVEFGTDQVRDAFLDWYAPGHDGIRDGAAEAVDTIMYHWELGSSLDERSFYACSPHRIEMTARMIRAQHDDDYASRAVELLPKWVQWCLERSGVDGDFAARSVTAALGQEEDEAPFRRQE